MLLSSLYKKMLPVFREEASKFGAELLISTKDNPNNFNMFVDNKLEISDILFYFRKEYNSIKLTTKFSDKSKQWCFPYEYCFFLGEGYGDDENGITRTGKNGYIVMPYTSKKKYIEYKKNVNKYFSLMLDLKNIYNKEYKDAKD